MFFRLINPDAKETTTLNAFLTHKKGLYCLVFPTKKILFYAATKRLSAVCDPKGWLQVDSSEDSEEKCRNNKGDLTISRLSVWKKKFINFKIDRERSFKKKISFYIFYFHFVLHKERKKEKKKDFFPREKERLWVTQRRIYIYIFIVGFFGLRSLCSSPLTARGSLCRHQWPRSVSSLR